MVGRVELQTRLVVGYQVDLRLYLLVTAQEDEIVLVQVELLIAECRPFGQQFEADAAILHLCRGTDSYAQLAVVVVVAYTCQGTVLVDMSVDEGVEHELRVPAVVTYLSLVGQLVAFLCEVQADGVDTDAVVVERVEVALAVDARLGRAVHVNPQFLEIDIVDVQQIDDGIVALALHMELHGGQQPFDGLLVDDLLVVLRHDGVGEGGHLSEQSLVAAFGIELHDEVAALCPHIGRVCCGAHQQSHVLWPVGLLVVLDIKLADEAVHAVCLLHV